jgi:class 3 adenylate cyclase
MGGSSADPIAAGRDAFRRHAWEEAYEALRETDQHGSLAGEGLHLLAQAAYWTGRPDETVEALERAFGAYRREGNDQMAAMLAFRVGEQYGMRGAFPQAQGWAARAMHLADGHPDWPVAGWLEWMGGLLAWFAGDFEAAVAQYDRSAQMAAAGGDRNLLQMSLHDKGHALTLMGRVAEGTALMDEAMTAVIGGELGPEAAGYVYCGMIGACSRLGDYGRAAEWTDATLRWAERESIPAVHGVCRIHQAELLLMRGSYPEAEQQARMACDELPRFNFHSELGPAYYEIGEVRRRLGDYRGAEEAFERANEFGHVPQPGLSLLRLAQGKTSVASAGIRQALVDVGPNHCAQLRLLAAQVKVALAVGDLETARSAVERLDSFAGEYRNPFPQAIAAGARGALRLAEDDAAGSLADLRAAKQAWEQIGAPYEVAEQRILLARAYRELGDDDAALMEARTARSGFERLGAVPAAEAAAGLVSELASGVAVERVSRAFMFTDIVKSTDLVRAIGDEAWEGLLEWHDQTLRSLFGSHGGQVAHHTGDGFLVAFQDARSALACGMAIQRALAEHRRAHGFAPQVRIGVHAAEATRRGQDYSGAEVHRAARIAALAEAGEILVTTETLASADGDFRSSEPRSVELKGFTQPVEVARLEWR